MSFDYVGRALGRIISQYRDDAKLRTLLTKLAELINTNFENYADVRRLLYSIDDMNGVQLDLIGRVLVRPRPAVLNIDDVFFGYAGTPGAVGYDVAPYYDFASESDIYVPLPDPAYQRLLKATVIKNTGDCSIDSIIRAAELITGDSDISLINNQDMTFELLFSVEPDGYTTILLNNFDVIPEPAGVLFSGWSVFVPEYERRFDPSYWTADAGGSNGTWNGVAWEFPGNTLDDAEIYPTGGWTTGYRRRFIEIDVQKGSGGGNNEYLLVDVGIGSIDYGLSNTPAYFTADNQIVTVRVCLDLDYDNLSSSGDIAGIRLRTDHWATYPDHMFITDIRFFEGAPVASLGGNDLYLIGSAFSVLGDGLTFTTSAAPLPAATDQDPDGIAYANSSLCYVTYNDATTGDATIAEMPLPPDGTLTTYTPTWSNFERLLAPTLRPQGDRVAAILFEVSPYLAVFDTATNTKLADPAVLPSEPPEQTADIRYSPAGTYLVYAGWVSTFPSGPEIIIYNGATMAHITTLTGGYSEITPLGMRAAFSNDESMLAVGFEFSSGNFIKIFNTSDWSIVHESNNFAVPFTTLDRFNQLIWTADDSSLVVVFEGGGMFDVLDTSNWTRRAVDRPPSFRGVEPIEITSGVISDDGATFVLSAGMPDNLFAVYDATTWRIQGLLEYSSPSDAYDVAKGAAKLFPTV